MSIKRQFPFDALELPKTDHQRLKHGMT
jgi:hypothetical protein